ncbi:MAG: prepilin-type N-terminal cleavage/methylation domain-containing protein [Tepidisphaeraceae bacterium]
MQVRSTRRSTKGFTLVEILIVVIILGILAAIVIPQFTSATTDARNNSASSLQNTIRSQLQLYRLEHNDQLPATMTGVSVGSNSTAAAWDSMIGKTNADHTTTGTPDKGPYMQAVPTNPLNSSNLVFVTNSDTANPSTAAGFILNTSNGRFWATDSTGKARLP